MFRKNITTNSLDKFTLGAYLSGLPEFETLFPLLKRLNERGELELKIFLSSKLCRIEPRAPKLLNELRMPYRLLNSNRMKFRELNAVLLISDPYMDNPRSHKKRNRYLVKSKLPSIYFQHGVIQSNVNCDFLSELDFPKKQNDYYATTAFLMEYPSQIHQTYFSKSALASVDISGFIRKPCFTANSVQPRVAQQLSNYDTRILFCHALHTKSFTNEEIQTFHSTIYEFAKDNPRIGVIVRPHRGKRSRRCKPHERKIDRNCKNVHFMYRYYGPLKQMAISDALSISDMMISTPSTAILDAIYMGKPVAVYMNYHEIFANLFQITDAPSIQRFVSDSCNHREGAEKLISRYGNLDENIERTCLKVEQIVNRISTQSHLGTKLSLR